MKQEEPNKVKPIFEFFKSLFPGYSTEYGFINDDLTRYYTFVVDSGTHRVVLKIYRAFWEDHSISEINNLLLTYKPKCIRLLQDKQDKVFSIPEFQSIG